MACRVRRCTIWWRLLYAAAFVADTVHLSPKLTLNLGLPLVEITIQAHPGWFEVDAQAAIPLGLAEVRLRIPAGSQPHKNARQPVASASRDDLFSLACHRALPRPGFGAQPAHMLGKQARITLPQILPK